MLVEEFTATVVELTPSVPSCIKQLEGPHAAIARLIREVREISDDRIEVDIRSATTTITFDRLDEIPAACAGGLTPLPEDEGYSRDPELVFEVFVETFYEHYAFFDLREVDWDAAVAEGRAAVSAETSDEELFDIMGEMIQQLADVHVSLESPFRALPSIEPPATLQLQEELDAAGGGDLEEYMETELDRYYRNIDGYLLEPAGGDNDPLAFGLLAEDLGYLRITHFGMEGTELEENLETLRTVLAAAADIPTLIVDLRINSGGCDPAAHAMASLFAAERTPVFQKSARFEGGETEPYAIYVEPDQIYDGRILLLTNENAGSSGEIFVLIMRTLPQVTLIGRPTMGILSDIMTFTLPNGWSVGLSNEIYRTMEGELFERVGIPPDVPIEAPLFSLEDRAAGVDRGLEFVLSWIDDNPV